MRENCSFELGADERERQRLASLAGLKLLDSDPEQEYDRLVALAAWICDAPMSSFTLVDRDRQWFKAALGLGPARESPRAESFCAHVIEQDELMVVEDARLDARFRHKACVTAKPHIRFYAGVPLGGASGAHLGTLCVADTKPRRLTDAQQNALRVLAEQVSVRMEMELQQRELREALETREKLMRELQASEDRFRTFMNNAPLLGFMKDAEGRFVFYNDYMAKEFAISKEAWLGKSVHDLFPAELADSYRKTDLEAMAAGGVVSRREETQDLDGGVKQWKSYKFPCLDVTGATMLGGISVDVTWEIKQQEDLERRATVDSLTGLANRRALNEMLEREVVMSTRTRKPLSVVMLDLDNFKCRNDELGHAAGDEILTKLARVLREETRMTDLAGRYGGEEFVLALPATDGAGAAMVAEKVRAAMQQESWPGGPVTASFGVATMRERLRSAGELMAEADAAMYMAKRAGKDRVVLARPDAGAVAERGTRLSSAA